MSYLENKKTHNETYVSFVKKFTLLGKSIVLKKHIGKEAETITKEKYLMDNFEELCKEEFNLRKNFLQKIKEDMSHNPELPEQIELKAIKINNLIEGKNCSEIIETEFAKEFIFNSNNIEGSKIPPERVREIIDTGDTRYKNKNEVKEVENSIAAMQYLRKSFKFDLNSIKRLYNILTKDLFREGNEPYPRGFKKEPNIVGNSETTTPERVEEELINLLNWYKDNKKKIHPLILAFEFHRKYELIHPFLDANGRTGRLIMNKILLSGGYYPVIVYKTNKIAYFNSIEKSKDGKIKNYYQFMLEQSDKTYDYILDTLKKY